MSKAEYWNAATMFPGYIHAIYWIFRKRLLMAPLAYILFNTCSIFYHLHMYWYGYNAFLHKLDMMSQQIFAVFICIDSSAGFQGVIIILNMLFITSTLDLNKNAHKLIAPLCTATSILVTTGYSLPCLYIWLISFACFLIGKATKKRSWHSVFHLVSHIALYYNFLAMDPIQ